MNISMLFETICCIGALIFSILLRKIKEYLCFNTLNVMFLMIEEEKNMWLDRDKSFVFVIQSCVNM